MHVYKIIFVLNTVHSIRQIDAVVMDGDITYQQHRGQLIYAFVRAANEEEAKQKGEELIASFLGK